MKKVKRSQKMYVNKNGFTLTELLIAMTIMVIILVAFSIMMNSSLRMFKTGSKSYEVQSDVLYASNSLNSAVRDSTAIFILNQSKYDPNLVTDANVQSNISAINLTDGWNYIGLNSTKTRIYNFVWDEQTSQHYAFELTVGEKGIQGRHIEYDLKLSSEKSEIERKINEYRSFSSLSPTQKAELEELEKKFKEQRGVLRFSLEGTLVDSDTGVINNETLRHHKIESIVDALNTKQVIDSTQNMEATAIAYRNTPINTRHGNQLKPTVALVLDFSGSMNWDIDACDFIRINETGGQTRVRAASIADGVAISYYGTVYYTHVFDRTSFKNPHRKPAMRDFYPMDQGQSAPSSSKIYYMDRKWTDKDIHGNTVAPYWYYFYKDASGNILERKDMLDISEDTRRVNILKTEYKKLIDRLEAIGDINLYVVPFSAEAFAQQNAAVQGYSLANLRQKQQQAPFIIGGDNSTKEAALKAVNDLKAYGGTNYGDGVDKALNYLRNSGQGRTYLMVLSDGAPTVYNNSRYNNSYNESGISKSVSYIHQVIDESNHAPNIVHLIGFSNVQRDNINLEKIKSYFSPATRADKVKVYKAGSSDELNKAFTLFAEDLEKDLWYFDGP